MRAAAIALAVAGFVVLAALAFLAPGAATDGWRAAFLLLSAPPIGAAVLLLIAGVVGADWDAALKPLLPAMPWGALLAVPVVLGQALFHQPPDHLHVWLSPPLYLLRSGAALLFWCWLARALARGRVAHHGPLLLAHGLAVSVMGYDWLLGVAPAQPNSAAPMMLATMQIGGAAAFVCAARLGRYEQRRDLAYLVIAAGLGLAYLLYIDFVIVWFGNLPAHAGWYVAREDMPIALLPALALLLGLVAPILLIGIGARDAMHIWAGRFALSGLGLVAAWMVAGPAGWLGLLAALAATLAVGASARGMAA